VRLVAQLKLLPDEQQSNLFSRTLAAANEACNHASRMAYENGIKKQFDIHRLVYRDLRDRFGLASQVAIRCIAKVANAYKTGNRKACRTFGRFAAQPYDDRLLRFCNDGTISIWTVEGRIKVPFVCGERQRELLAHRKGEADLVRRGKRWFLMASCEVEEPAEDGVDDFLGVDLGVVNLAVDSDGEAFSGSNIENQRRRFSHRRRNLQRKGTRAARRKLRCISGRQARYQKDVNHCISKALVQKAQRTSRGIALEDLKGIRDRVTARRRQRARLANWSFFQLRSFVSYKARLLGVPVLLVDPRHTSQECPECGHTKKANRTDRDWFACVSCGHAGAADHIAARNIRVRAFVNRPNGDREVFKVASGGCLLHLPSVTSRLL
jgi:putative transposase